MARRFEELGFAATDKGEISLRRRTDPVTGEDVFEVKLDDEYLMSSLFTVAEEALADLGLAAVQGSGLDVLVGGLGLGCTAVAALRSDRVASVVVVEALAEVVTWHEQGLLPLSAALTADARTTLLVEDFFAAVDDGTLAARGPWHALLVDIDHSPRLLLDDAHAGFYTADGLRRLEPLLQPRGVFALWSDEPPEPAFLALLGEVFDDVSAPVVPFANRLTGGTSSNTVYLARRR